MVLSQILAFAIFASNLILSSGKIIYVTSTNSSACSGTGSDASPYPNIQCALQAANSGDTIFLREGIYFGANNTNICLNGCTADKLRLLGSNSSQYLTSNTIIDCAGSSTGLSNVNNRFIHLENIAFRKCVGTVGGAVYVHNTTMDLIRVSFLNNSATDGGGIHISESNVTMKDCDVVGNYASVQGGGIAAHFSTLKITGGTIRDNRAYATSYGNGVVGIGGGIFFKDADFNNVRKHYNMLHVRKVYMIMNNTAAVMGGAVYAESDSKDDVNIPVQFDVVGFMDNGITGSGLCVSSTSCVLRGGAVYLSSFRADIRVSSFLRNYVTSTSDDEVGSGGALYATNRFDSKGLNLPSQCGLTIYLTAFTSNNASNFGGAMYLNNQNLSLTYSSFDKNFAGEASYLFSDQVSAGGAIWYSVYKLAGVIKNVTFSENGVIGGWGGGLYITSSSGLVSIVESRFFRNLVQSSYTFAGQGAGMMVSHDSMVAITDSIFDSNVVKPRVDTVPFTYSGFGGAIYAQSAYLSIMTSNFTNNTALTGQFDSGSAGGAIIFEDVGSSIIDRCHFNNNGAAGFLGLSTYASSGTGGAIALKFSSLNITHSYFNENWVSAGGSKDSLGGAIGAFFGYPSGADNGVVVDHCVFTNNTALSEICITGGPRAGQGGAISVVGISDGLFNISSSIFENNMAYSVGHSLSSSLGGAISVTLTSKVGIFDSEFNNNDALSGYGNDLASFGSEENSVLSVNTIFHGLNTTHNTAWAEDRIYSACKAAKRFISPHYFENSYRRTELQSELDYIDSEIDRTLSMQTVEKVAKRVERLMKFREHVKSDMNAQNDMFSKSASPREEVSKDVVPSTVERNLRTKTINIKASPSILISSGNGTFRKNTFKGFYYVFAGDVDEFSQVFQTQRTFTNCSISITNLAAQSTTDELVLLVANAESSLGDIDSNRMRLSELHLINSSLTLSNDLEVLGNSTLVAAKIKSTFYATIKFMSPVTTTLGLTNTGKFGFARDDDATFTKYYDPMTCFSHTSVEIYSSLTMAPPFLDIRPNSTFGSQFYMLNADLTIMYTASLLLYTSSGIVIEGNSGQLINNGQIYLNGFPFETYVMSKFRSLPISIDILTDNTVTNSLQSPFSVSGPFSQGPNGTIHIYLNSSYQTTPVVFLQSNQSLLGSISVAFINNPLLTLYGGAVSTFDIIQYNTVAANKSGQAAIVSASSLGFSTTTNKISAGKYRQLLQISNIPCHEITASYYKFQSDAVMEPCSICLMNSSCVYCGTGGSASCVLDGQCHSSPEYSESCCDKNCHAPHGSCNSDFNCDCIPYYDGESCANLSTLTVALIASAVFFIVVAIITFLYYRYSQDQKNQVLEELRQGLLFNDNANTDPEYIRSMQQALVLKDVFVKFDEIKLENKIGEGSFGVVYKATFRGAQVAVKQMRSMFMELTEHDIEEFRKEAYMMSRLRHPNIVLVMGISLMDQEPPQHPKRKTLSLSVDEDRSRFASTGEKTKAPLPKTICIITEYLEQGSLADILYGPTRLPAEVWTYDLILTCALQAARGMLYLHSHSPPICHRDLKSSNLVVDDHWVVKVTDFGMSRIVPEKVQELEIGIDVESPEYTRESLAQTAASSVGSMISTNRKDGSRVSFFNPEMTSNLGTTAWCAPELLTASNKTRYSVKVDVYSFGMVLWELWEKKRPFDEFNSRFDIVDAIRSGKRPPVSDNCPPAFRSLMQRCWQAEPARRPTFQYIVRYLKDELARVKRQRNATAMNTHAPAAQSLDSAAANRNFFPNFLTSSNNSKHDDFDNDLDEMPSVPEETETITQLRKSFVSNNEAHSNNGSMNSRPTAATLENDRSTTSRFSFNFFRPKNSQMNSDQNLAGLAEENEERMSGSQAFPVPLPNGRSPLVAAFDRSLSHLALSPNVSVDNTPPDAYTKGSLAAIANNTSLSGATNKSNTWRDKYVMKFSGWKQSQPDTGLPPSLAGQPSTPSAGFPSTFAANPMTSSIGNTGTGAATSANVAKSPNNSSFSSGVRSNHSIMEDDLFDLDEHPRSSGASSTSTARSVPPAIPVANSGTGSGSLGKVQGQWISDADKKDNN